MEIDPLRRSAIYRPEKIIKVKKVKKIADKKPKKDEYVQSGDSPARRGAGFENQ